MVSDDAVGGNLRGALLQRRFLLRERPPSAALPRVGSCRRRVSNPIDAGSAAAR
jgi:hypothetical protein